MVAPEPRTGIDWLKWDSGPSSTVLLHGTQGPPLKPASGFGARVRYSHLGGRGDRRSAGKPSSHRDALCPSCRLPIDERDVDEELPEVGETKQRGN